jgi:hypothetical protein
VGDLAGFDRIEEEHGYRWAAAVKELDIQAERLSRDMGAVAEVFGVPSEDMLPEERLAFLRWLVARAQGGEVEWGVRFPSGAVSPQPDEETARRYALAYTSARPDLPTLVTRRIVTDWEVPTDG